jgi:acyl-coenzyme A thioesterase PaaI-like protein
MLKLIPRHRLRVPHGLAMAGALLLLASTVTGVGGALQTEPGQAAAGASTYLAEREADSGRQSADSLEAVRQAPAKKKTRFKINLFLFRR